MRVGSLAFLNTAVSRKNEPSWGNEPPGVERWQSTAEGRALVPAENRPYTISEIRDLARHSTGGLVNEVVEGFGRFDAFDPRILQNLEMAGIRIAFTNSLPPGAGAVYVPLQKLVELPMDPSEMRPRYERDLKPTFKVPLGAFLVTAELMHAVDDVQQRNRPFRGILFKSQADESYKPIARAYQAYARKHIRDAGGNPRDRNTVREHFIHGLKDPAGPHLLGVQGLSDSQELIMEGGYWILSDPSARQKLEARFPDVARYVREAMLESVTDPANVVDRRGQRAVA